ncbi:hypothetical protein EVAR_64701_1 [Eumeta japonica]|uniref:Uncharacterized protein n=1 Tax=Eumeta variegata TaxID=151549 RepID=A0A4C1ZR51_EUMVA|nr:hypothetical protein EVAR_64701_1 [Eumeta japonica]
MSQTAFRLVNPFEIYQRFIHAHTHARTYTHTRARAQAHTHTRMRVRAHTHKPIFFLRRCPNAETLSRHESPDCGAKRGFTHATPVQPMPPRGELLN